MLQTCKSYRLTLSFLLVLLIVVPTTFAQGVPEPDPIVQAALDQGLLTQIDQSQAVGDVTVTVNWAYVDTQKVMVNYTIVGAAAEVFGNPFRNPVVLRDGAGVSFSIATAQNVNIASPEEATFLTQFYNQGVIEADDGTIEVVDDYFHNGFESVPESIDLQLELNYESFEIEDWMPIDATASDYQVGDTVEGIGPFVFDFTVPVYDSIQLEPMQSVSVNDLEMTLETLSLTPTAAEARICYDMPDERDWIPEASISIEGVAGQVTGMGITDMAQFENAERRCRNVSFDLFYNDEADNLTLSLDYLTTSMAEGPQDWERIEAVLAEEGIDIDVIFSQGENGGGGISIEEVDVPDDFDLQAAMNRAREKLGDRLAGPWVFEVELP